MRIAALLAIAAAGGMLFSRLDFPNPWMMGPLLATIAVTASGIQLSSIPGWLTNVGQVLLGCALGARFSRDFLSTAPRFVSVTIATIFLMMLLSTAMAWGLSWAAGIFWPSMVLACAPGGIAEMSITARTLQLGVALVTAAHVTRVVIIVSTTLPLYQALLRWRAGRGASARRGSRK